ncbi:GNAT family N-acetyltransferase [Symbioplanes lichenis]|uniref:GNAT family N-acetyltransferase n=1 Tax=Symbioplanes lichenis TaxID=1629072 RepID=UPI00273A4685|nr:GNAT family N-acetyltransferase [Actinoplanes lichenis]
MSISADHLTGPCESIEAGFMEAYESGTPASAAAELGITTRRLGGGVALAMRHDPTGYWSKALGFGVTEPVTDKLVGELVEHYREHGNDRAVIQIAPALLPADWDEIARRHGLRRGATWVKLGARPEEVGTAPTGLRVGPATAEHARAWAELVLGAFGMPLGPLTEMLIGSFDDPGFHPFGAWDGDRLVGAGNLYVHDGVASLNTGATHPGFRGRGAQSALIGVRAAKARELGCPWIFTETGLPAEGTNNPSLDNMRRLGLRDLYHRDNWIWDR